MYKSFKNILIAALSVAMLVGSTITALAVGSENGPGVPAGSEASAASGPDANSGPGVSGNPDETSGPGISGGTAAVVTDTTADNAAETPADTVSIPLAALAPDVRQMIAATQLTVTVMRPEFVWTPASYVTTSGTSIIAETGFLSLSVDHTSLPGDVMFRTYTSAGGWTSWCMNGTQSPWNAGILVEAVQIRLKGVLNDYYDVSYAATLSDGTTCGWSYNGATNGTMNVGKYIIALQVYLSPKGAYDTNGTDNQVVCPAGYDGIQFSGGFPTYVNGSGQPFTGWAFHGNDQYYFVNNMAVTGWQYLDGYKYYFDESGKLVEDLEPIIGATGPFLIKVNKQMNCTTVYVADGANGFIIPLKSFLCSTGSDTPIGTFHSPEKIRWNLMIHDVYCQYLTRLNAGYHILLHSGVYNARNPFSLQPQTYNFMGIARSAGCIRFIAKDCKWIYDNCPIGTTIQVYNSPVPGPYERPCIPQVISSSQTWDPTDVEALAILEAQQAALAAQ